ncbi:MAG: M20 family metallo-hydrolase [Cyclobacteriaceae bacterium]|nr:M20 family metallo-hydrolase [Cyclobacteriaceae bacterium]
MDQYIQLLQKLIETPSISREEEHTAQIIHDFFASHSIETQRIKNNVIVRNKHFTQDKPLILLNSHHDTVKPNASWKKDPFFPLIIDRRLYGLGSNDAGGPLVALMAAFMHFYDHKNLPYNLIFTATAEEEISGKNGVALVLPHLGPIEFAIVGEPTRLKMAIAEKGLMVLDCTVRGQSGHAARDEGENAIYNALDDIHWFQSYRFDRQSDLLGAMKMSVTVINAGTQHNVVPDECRFVVDLRTTDAYTNEEILDIIAKNVQCEVVPRSTRLQASGLPGGHLLLALAKKLKIDTFGSPTLSDQALMPFPSVKIGPGDSARSHTADEFIELDEIRGGMELYLKMLKALL